MIEKSKFEEWTYSNERVLKYLYTDEGWDQKQIADEFDTTKSTISRWMSQFDIETNYRTIDKLGEEEVKRLYWEEGKSQKEIAEMVGSRQANISRYMREHGIETRTASHTPATFYTDPNGYESWYSKRDNTRYPVHRLVAVAEYGIDVVSDRDVHHENKITWDNRVENLRPVSRDKHAKEHRMDEYGDEPWWNEEKLRVKYIKEKKTAEEIAKEWGCSMATVYSQLHRFDIETRPSVAGGYYNEN